MANLSFAQLQNLSSHVASRNQAVQENVRMQAQDLNRAVKVMANMLYASGGLESFDFELATSLVKNQIVSNPAMNILNYGGDVGIEVKSADQTDFHLANCKYSVNSSAQGISATSSDGIQYIQQGKMTDEDGSVHVGVFSLSEGSRKSYLSQGVMYLPDGSKHVGKMTFHESLGKSLLSDGTITKPNGEVVTLKTVRDDRQKKLTVYLTTEDGKVSKVESALDKKSNKVQCTVTKPNGQTQGINRFLNSVADTSVITEKSKASTTNFDQKASVLPWRRPNAEAANHAEKSSLKPPTKLRTPPDAEAANHAEKFSLKPPRRPLQTVTPSARMALARAMLPARYAVGAQVDLLEKLVDR